MDDGLERGRRSARVRAVAARSVAERRLQAALVACRERYPEVPVQLLLSRAQPAEAILRAARDAELVVICASRGADRRSSRLDPMRRTVPQHTSCPVAMVGARHQRHSRRPALLQAEA